MLALFKKYKFETILVVASAVSLILRLWKLTSLPVFADEAIYVRWAQIMRAEETLRFLPLSDGKQPLFMWIVIPFLKLFSDPLFAGRLVSVFCGAISVVGIYLSSEILFKSKKVALISALLASFSPFLVFFDRMALVDSMLTMFAVWTFYFAVLNVQRLQLDLAMIMGMTLGGALLTKSPGLFFAILLPFTAVLLKWPKEAKERLKIFAKFVLLTCVSLAIGYGLYNILRLGTNFHLLSSRNLDYVYPYSHVLVSPLSPLLTYLKISLEYYWLLAPAAILGLFIVGLIVSLKRYWKQSLLILVWFSFPLFAICEFGKVFTARYILFSLPFIILISGAAFLTKKSLVIRGVVVLLAIFIIHSLAIDYLLLTDVQKVRLPRSERSGYLEQWTAGFGIREIAIYLRTEELKNQGTKIVVGTEGYFGTLPDGLQMYLNDLPKITVIGVGLGIDKIPTPLAESVKSGNKTYLVVNSTRLLADPNQIGLTLISSYPKAVKPDGSRESLLLFEVVNEK